MCRISSSQFCGQQLHSTSLEANSDSTICSTCITTSKRFNHQIYSTLMCESLFVGTHDTYIRDGSRKINAMSERLRSGRRTKGQGLCQKNLERLTKRHRNGLHMHHNHFDHQHLRLSLGKRQTCKQPRNIHPVRVR